MSWGDSVASTWHSATEGARAAASAIATGAKSVADGTAAAVQFIARETKAAVKSAGKAIARTATAIADKAVEATDWAVQKSKDVAQSIKKAAIAAKNATVEGIATAYKAAKKVFSKVKAGVAAAACALENWLTDAVALVGGFTLTKLGNMTELLRLLLKAWGDESQKPFDGQVIGAGCQENSPTGVMPSASCKSGALPKIVYVNGINTRKEDMCATMAKLAQATCSEVTGVYNATEGMGRDLDECLDNIAKNSNSPPVITLRGMILDAARKGQPLTLFAHSQGGLITQEAIAQAKQQLIHEDNISEEEAEQRLGVVSVKSFGTAQWGWPKGPHYERFTNTADPVPAVIAGAQTSFPVETWSDSAGAEQYHVFTDPHWNPIDSHSMDDTYLPKYREIKGAPQCSCAGN